MQRALISKLVPDMRPQVEPRVRALDQAIAKRLGVPAGLGNAPAASAPAARPPAKK